MSISIGIRTSPTQVLYCISDNIDEENILIKILDKIIIPKALEVPDQLKYVRNTLLDIINENKVSRGCIRITESNAQRINISRIYLEGVIQEMFASSTITSYYTGQISSISNKLSIDRKDFKKLLSGDKNFQIIQNWTDYNEEERESILASISALYL